MFNAIKRGLSRKTLALAILAFGATAAQAGLIGSFDHQYGNTAGKAKASAGTAGTCDVLNASSITVREGSNCQRFVDLFDFSALNITSLDKLVLSLNFSGNGLFENWNVRPADSTTHASSSLSLMDQKLTGGVTTQTFEFKPGLDVFSTIKSNEKFYLWFANEAWGSYEFTLNSAKLDVYGTVPEPSSLALLGLAGLGLVGVRRQRQAKRG